MMNIRLIKKFFSQARYLRIQEILNNEFNPSYLNIVNESYLHSVPKEYETHFKITIVSKKFENKLTIDRHKLIYKLLQNEMGEKNDNKLHAVSIFAKTTEEWGKSENPQTPNCLNKNL